MTVLEYLGLTKKFQDKSLTSEEFNSLIAEYQKKYQATLQDDIAAEQQANEILSNARGEAQRVRMMALDHCAELFKRCETEAITVANELRDARIQLDQER